MGDKSSIEWTDATWNSVAGCSVVSPGCTNCYAMKMAHRIEGMNAALGKATHYGGLTKKTKGGAVWTGKMAVAPEHILTLPLRWKRPRRIFVNSMSDLFHEGVSDETIDKVFAVMQRCPQHTFQVLTKRATRMQKYMAALVCGDGHRSYVRRPGWKASDPRDGDRVLLLDEGQSWPLPHVWLGVSVEDRARKDRIDDLKRTPAAVHFLSCEPLLENLGELELDGIDLVIVGGESGPRSRDFEIEAARSIQQQCKNQNTPFFLKQLGAVPTLGRGALKLKDRKGGDMSEWPEDLRVREFPT